jgi:hypothetical protein
MNIKILPSLAGDYTKPPFFLPPRQDNRFAGGGVNLLDG